jgi:hypothetical protein
VLHTETSDRPIKPALEIALRALVAEELQNHFVDVGDSGDILVRD